MSAFAFFAPFGRIRLQKKPPRRLDCFVPIVIAVTSGGKCYQLGVMRGFILFLKKVEFVGKTSEISSRITKSLSKVRGHESLSTIRRLQNL